MKDVDFDRLGKNFSSEKTKNEMSGSENYYAPKERGGCLTAFLGFAIIGNIFILILYLATFSAYRGQVDGGTQLLIFGIFAVQVGIFVSVIGLWNWKHWGYNGMLAGYVISIIISILLGGFTSIGGSILGIVILTQLMKDKMELLD